MEKETGGDERRGEEGAIGRDNGAISGMIDAVACGQDVSRSSDAPAALAAEVAATYPDVVALGFKLADLVVFLDVLLSQVLRLLYERHIVLRVSVG